MTRLSILEPRSRKDRIKYAAFKQAFGFFPDVSRTMFASTDLDINAYRTVLNAYHRRSPFWTKGETELFASFVSAQNDCNFWMLTHGAVASRYMGKDVVYEAFADWTKAQVRPEVKATLGMLAKLTLQPLEFNADDMRTLLDIGIKPAAIEQAAIIGGFIFNYQNRMADALGADVPPDKVERAGKMLNMQGRSMLKDHNSKGEVTAFNGRIPPEIETLVENVTNGNGNSDVALRRSVFKRGMAYLGFAETDTQIPSNLVHYVDTTTRYAPDVSEQDVKDLLAASWSEAEVFEVTVVASVAAGYGRLLIAWNTLAEAQP